MWGVVDDSAEEPWHELWGLFRPDGDVSWQHKALCAQTDPEAFFPEKGGSTRDECLKWAIDHDERFGIWGGMSERERRRYKREHRERA